MVCFPVEHPISGRLLKDDAGHMGPWGRRTRRGRTYRLRWRTWSASAYMNGTRVGERLHKPRWRPHGAHPGEASLHVRPSDGSICYPAVTPSSFLNDTPTT